MSEKFTGHISPIVPPFPARGLSRRCGLVGSWWRKLELLKPGFVQEAYGCSTSGGTLVTGAQWKKKKKKNIWI
jgi:hypothetical protein